MIRICARYEYSEDAQGTNRQAVRIFLAAAFLLLTLAPACVPSRAQDTGQTQKPAQAPPAKTKPEKKPAAKRLIVNLTGFEMLKPVQLKSQVSTLAATRGGLPPTALAPKLGKFYGESAMFAWKYPGESQKFSLAITDDRGKAIFRTEVAGNNFVYPSDAPRLEAGKVYSWIVQMISAQEISPPSSPVEFVPVSDGERKEMEQALAAAESKDAYESGLERAKIFVEHRLWYDAIGAYSELISRFPERVELYENRGMIYAQLQITQPLSDKDFSRADQLEAQAKSK